MNRLEANMQLLAILTNEVLKYPDLRFHQILTNLDIIQQHPKYSGAAIDEFYTESVDVLERVQYTQLKET